MQKRKKQKRNTGERILAVVLAVCLLVAVCPDLWSTVTVQAANIITEDTTWSGTLAAGTYTIKPGVTVKVSNRLQVTGNVTIKGGGRLVRGYKGDTSTALHKQQ